MLMATHPAGIYLGDNFGLSREDEMRARVEVENFAFIQAKYIPAGCVAINMHIDFPYCTSAVGNCHEFVVCGILTSYWLDDLPIPTMALMLVSSTRRGRLEQSIILDETMDKHHDVFFAEHSVGTAYIQASDFCGPNYDRQNLCAAVIF